MIKKLDNFTGKLVAVIQILALTLLASCATVCGGNSSTVCHATDDPASPYEEITVNKTELNEHLGHPHDFHPVPVTGCPANPVVVVDGEITICHAAHSDTDPYHEISISVNGLNGHGEHEDDIIPMPEEGCPITPISNNNDKITICHATGSEKNPYNEITVSVNGLNGHDKHDGDIIPAPADGCPIPK